MIKVSQNPRTARTLHNKKDAFGVKHDTENEQSRAELVRGCMRHWKQRNDQSPIPIKSKTADRLAELINVLMTE